MKTVLTVLVAGSVAAGSALACGDNAKDAMAAPAATPQSTAVAMKTKQAAPKTAAVKSTTRVAAKPSLDQRKSASL